MMAAKKRAPGDIYDRLGGGGTSTPAKNKAPKVTLVPVKKAAAKPQAAPKAAPKSKAKSSPSMSLKKTSTSRYSTKPGKIAGTPPPKKATAKPKASTKPGKIAGTPPPKAKATVKKSAPKSSTMAGRVAPMVDNGNTAADANVQTWSTRPTRDVPTGNQTPVRLVDIPKIS